MCSLLLVLYTLPSLSHEIISPHVQYPFHVLSLSLSLSSSSSFVVVQLRQVAAMRALHESTNDDEVERIN
jgi:hypothetical protein